MCIRDRSGTGSVFRELALIKVNASPQQRSEVHSLASIFNAAVIDVSADCMIVQIAETSTKVNSLIELLRPFGIVESLRTGHVAMVRGMGDGVRHTPGAAGVSVNGVNGTGK